MFQIFGSFEWNRQMIPFQSNHIANINRYDAKRNGKENAHYTNLRHTNRTRSFKFETKLINHQSNFVFICWKIGRKKIEFSRCECIQKRIWLHEFHLPTENRCFLLVKSSSQTTQFPFYFKRLWRTQIYNLSVVN